MVWRSAVLGALTLMTLSPARALAPDASNAAGITEHLGAALPLDLLFTNQDGCRVRLGDVVRGAPTVLVLVYLHCPVLCGFVLRGVERAVQQLEKTAPPPFHVVTVSFDPNDTPLAARNMRAKFVQELAAGPHPPWTLLVGRQPQIGALTSVLGFRFHRDPRTGHFTHPAAIFVLTPGGTLSRYLYGVQYPASQLRRALEAAAHGEVGASFNRPRMCSEHKIYKFIPDVLAFLRGATALSLLALGFMYVRVWRADSQRPRRRPPATPPNAG